MSSNGYRRAEPGSVPSQQSNEAVDLQRNRVTAARALQSATTFADAGQLDKARKVKCQAGSLLTFLRCCKMLRRL